MSTTIAARPKKVTGRFTWRCWHDGQLRDVVITPTSDEKNSRRQGLYGRIYERQGRSLRTVSGTVHQDGDGKVYFLPSF
jgi:hypothetical protein